MNDLLIKNAKIISQESAFNEKVMDVLIENGIIKSIKSKISNPNKIKEITGKNLHLSAGWFDMQADFCDPGYEHKEDLESGIKSAVSGGFSGVAIVSSTDPSIHSKADIQYIKNKTKSSIVDVYPIGSVSNKREGKNISEMFDKGDSSV